MRDRFYVFFFEFSNYITFKCWQVFEQQFNRICLEGIVRQLSVARMAQVEPEQVASYPERTVQSSASAERPVSRDDRLYILL